MPIQVDAYLSGGIATGTFARAGQLRDFLETSSELPLAGASWQALDGATPGPSGDVSIASDDCLIVVSDDDPFIAAHAAWHSIELEVGPYTVSGDLPTLPGFDPGRALTRPSGEFVMLRDVRLGLRRRPGDDHRVPPRARQPLRRRPRDGRPDARLLLPGRRDGRSAGGRRRRR